MSAIAGSCRFGGSPDAVERANRMLEAQAVYGPDGHELWSAAGIALGGRVSRITPEDAFFTGIVQSQDGNLIVAADLRLDNRDELCRDLKITGARAAALSDAALLVAALERWGEAVVDKLCGEFAFAAWNRRERKLLLARDFAGLRPLHYHQGVGFFAFASMPAGLRVLPEVPCSHDEERVTGFLLLQPETGPRSFYAGISRVEPGQIVTVTETALSARSYWDPPPHKLHLRNAEDYAEGLRHHLREAVRSRLRGASRHVGAHLSGGFDSSAVTASAARILAETGGRVTAFTAVPREGYSAASSTNYIADEGPAAAATAAMYANVDHVLIRAGHVSPFDGLARDYALYGRPSLNICNHPWMAAINDAARERGLRVLLTGQMGNMSVSYAGFELFPELLRAGRLWKLFREGRALTRNRYGTWRRVLGASLLPFVPNGVSRRREESRYRDSQRWTAISGQKLKRAVHFSSELTLKSPCRDGCTARTQAFRRVDPGNFNKGMLGGWGIEVRDPTADRRLVEFCLSIPTEQFLANGVPRALARLALSGMLPGEILRERRTGFQAIDWHEGLTAGRQQAIGELERLAQCVPAADLLDLARLHALTTNWPAGGWDESSVRDAWLLALPRGIALGYFVRRANEPETFAAVRQKGASA